MLYIGIGILVLALFVSSLTWGLMFALGFLVLTIVYIVIAICVIYGVAMYYEIDLMECLGNNNTWFFVLLGASAVTFVIACFNFGPAVLLPESFPTTGQRSVVTNVFNHLLYGKGAPSKSVPTNPLPWATGTWFWWKAWGLYSLLTFGYFWFAFWDETSHAFHAMVKFINKRRVAHRPQPGQPPVTNPGGHGHGPEPTGHSFGELLKVEFLVEIVSEFFKAFMTRRRRT